MRSEMILMLAERPGDERQFAPLIAALCRAGRPPFVVVLTDGPIADPGADALVGQGLAGLGLAGRMLMFGIAGALPRSGPVFDAALRGVCFVSWRHDCNVVLVPDMTGPVHALARAAVAESGLGLATYDGGQVQLITAPRPSARPDENLPHPLWEAAGGRGGNGTKLGSESPR